VALEWLPEGEVEGKDERERRRRRDASVKTGVYLEPCLKQQILALREGSRSQECAKHDASSFHR
jgi:hypothetical protein